jgi:hypothetical protein
MLLVENHLICPHSAAAHLELIKHSFCKIEKVADGIFYQTILPALSVFEAYCNLCTAASF